MEKADTKTQSPGADRSWGGQCIGWWSWNLERELLSSHWKVSGRGTEGTGSLWWCIFPFSSPFPLTTIHSETTSGKRRRGSPPCESSHSHRPPDRHSRPWLIIGWLGTTWISTRGHSFESWQHSFAAILICSTIFLCIF